MKNHLKTILSSNLDLPKEETFKVIQMLPFDAVVSNKGNVKFTMPPIENDSNENIGLQYSFGADIQSILVLAFASLPALFFKAMIEESGKDFWIAIKNLLKKIACKKQDAAMRSIQIKFETQINELQKINIIATVFNAHFLTDENFMGSMNEFLGEAILKIESLKKNDLKKDEKEIHAIIDGNNKIEWMEKKD